MSIDEIKLIVADIHYQDYTIEVFEKNGVPYLQGRYLEPDIVTGDPTDQHTRKWMLSEHMVESEIVQTALLLALTSAEHRVREHFKYQGQRVFSPHFDVKAFQQLSRDKRFEYRK